MSRNAKNDGADRKNDTVAHQEQREEEEEERFYESLDRIASSSASCSCSTSNSDSEPDPNPNPIPDSTRIVSSSSYDVWISQPTASISERRQRLLHQMGLSSDPSLSRVSPDPDFHKSDRLGARIVRSKSDGDDFSSCSSSTSFVYSSSIVFRDLMDVNSCNSSNSKKDKGNTDREDDVNIFGSCKKPMNCSGSTRKAAVSPNKPPLGKNGGRRADVNPLKSVNSNGNLSSNWLGAGVNELVEDLDCNVVGESGGVDVDVAVEEVIEACTIIKNLDNGKEFVVNETKEDGMWNKLKEVGTGRQLTMEEFEMSVGHSPIVQELMRRQIVEDGSIENLNLSANGGVGQGSSKHKKKGSWFKNITSVASSVTGYKERRNSDERDTGSDKGGRRSSSATDDSQDVSFHGPERVRVRPYGKSFKELSALYKTQEIQAHNGSIWSIKFSLDGRYLASAGEDCVIHVWQVVESERKGELLMEKYDDGNLNLMLMANGSPEPSLLSPTADSHHERKRRGRSSINWRSLSFDPIIVPETVFALADKPICSFQGHLDDVLDLSWSKSQHLLSSSMDKTVRLWHLSSRTCLKIFSHSDYVTCIQFNPVDDRYFISGSLDSRVRIWSIPDHKVVDWNDLHEMVTAACYTPDGKGAFVGSYKGSCCLYNTSDNKLQQKYQINLQNMKKKAHLKKITGFQFAPGSSSEVLVTSSDSRIRVVETSSDSRIRVVDGVDLVHKFKGFRNTSSQISASLTANGKYVVSASEDSHVYVWKNEADSRPSRSKGVTVTHSYEHFHCQDVSVAIPWPGMGDIWGLQDGYSVNQNVLDNHLEEVSIANHPPTPVEETSGNEGSQAPSGCTNSPLNGIISSATNGYFYDRILATWPEERLNLATRTQSPQTIVDISSGLNQNLSAAYGMVIVTAGLRGEIRTFQNFGLPVRILRSQR